MDDRAYLLRAVDLALEAERAGNPPVGALITLDGAIIAEGANAIAAPFFHPGRHAEVVALGAVPPGLWPRRRSMTCYTTLEPCVMCYGALLLHGVGRIVFGAGDPQGGAGCLRAHLPPYFAGAGAAPVWDGPLLPERCDDLYARVARLFARIDRTSRRGTRDP
jgi:tRNA(adenine34) deaminase